MVSEKSRKFDVLSFVASLGAFAFAACAPCLHWCVKPCSQAHFVGAQRASQWTQSGLYIHETWKWEWVAQMGQKWKLYRSIYAKNIVYLEASHTSRACPSLDFTIVQTLYKTKPFHIVYSIDYTKSVKTTPTPFNPATRPEQSILKASPAPSPVQSPTLGVLKKKISHNRRRSKATDFF